MPAIHPAYEDRRKAVHRIDASRVWAVLIGIDVYPSSDCTSLRGCVNDVKKMAKFLTEDLGVPNDHIQCLLGASSQSWSTIVNIILSVYHYFVSTKSTPTRINIIDTLLNLSMKPEIQYNDNIIIYFAGHASSYKCSDYHIEGGPSAEGHIEALCPMDRTAPSGTDDNIPDISDREINTILTEISRTKGRHITFILDCCYSAGNTRGPLNVRRGAVPLPPATLSATKIMLEHAHTRLRDLPKYHSVFDGHWKPDMSSHVALAACKDYQPAEEGPGTDSRWNGMFTGALIEVLKSDNLTEGSTYADLIDAVKEKMSRNTTQMPVVAGNADSRLWYQPQV
ncbi:peptidase C14 [Armillaria gallica]|uniref:Peptidase C14 n=1 Tax=Armillaria gallica TaxID=47427 RepID=A0A2H3CZH7_ARMGA|nr:peptidase C14 [Armillaria gallica]